MEYQLFLSDGSLLFQSIQLFVFPPMSDKADILGNLSVLRNIHATLNPYHVEINQPLAQPLSLGRIIWIVLEVTLMRLLYFIRSRHMRKINLQ